jgi:hypothetical protein
MKYYSSPGVNTPFPNYALSLTGKDGANVTSGNISNENWWTTLGTTWTTTNGGGLWSKTIWNFDGISGTNKLPTLINVGGNQNPVVVPQ